uniref:Peptidase M13 C-terminal domain-containing protein n=1 Tax=viral metagenome TaxID=1070528 RepID=A0A6C0B087_9ZZZZ
MTTIKKYHKKGNLNKIKTIRTKTAKLRKNNKASDKNQDINKEKSEEKGNRGVCVANIGLQSFEKSYTKFLLSSKSKDKGKSNDKKEFVKNLLLKFSPSKIKPNNDFYDYINYNWLKQITLEKKQKYIVQVDDFRLTQDKVYKQLNEIILDYIKHNDDELAKNMKQFYDSIVHANSKKHSRKYANAIVHKIDSIRFDKKNVWKMLAFVNKSEIVKTRAPFVWSINPDNKHSQVNRCYVDPHVFSILDLSVYFDDGTDVEYKKKFRNEFKQFCKKVFDTVLGPHHGFHTDDIFEVEMDMMNAFNCPSIKEVNNNGYNKITTHESLSKYGFNWAEFSKELGFSYTPPFYITSSLSYLKCGTELLVQHWDSEKWRTYWIFIFFKKITRMTKDWEKLNYEFHGKFERGQSRINDSDAVSTSLYMSVPFNTFLTNQYVAKYQNPQNVKYVETLCNDLKIVFSRIIEKNTWMSPPTKKYALLKLKHLHFMIAKPETLRPDPLLNYGTSVIENMDKITAWRHQELLALEGKGLVDIPFMDWTQYPVKLTGTQAYIVNASYTPSQNSIYINLGYMQKPFLDLEERGIEYNLAHIGFTICHEMSHVFDDWGSQYDYEGNLKDWWTPADKKKYADIQKDVIKQYEVFAARDGIHFDASIGIGEDLADISGLAICDEYLQDYGVKNNDIAPIKIIGFEAFYIFYAYQQKQLIGKKALAAQLKTNPHPLDKYRCNIPLSRSQIFRALYDVKRGDGMWWHNTNTVW